MQQVPLSVCTIYSGDDSDKLKYCDEPLPGNIERIKLMTQPSGEFGMNLPVVNYRNKNSVNALWKYKTKPFDTFSFSDAKNACKLLASREWILYLDADDVIQWIDSDFQSVFELGNEYGYVNCTVVSHRGNDDKPEMGWLWVNSQSRLYRNKKNFKYIYRVHENILPSIQAAGYSGLFSDIIIKHTGYNVSDDDMLKKMLRNLDYLSYDLQHDYKDNPYLKQKLNKTIEAIKQLGYFDGIQHSERYNSQV